VPLSTSNSSERAAKHLGDGGWKAVWIAVIATFFIFILSWEVAWRIAGFSPNIPDDWRLWSEIRRAANKGDNTVALVGSSRILLGLDPALLEEMVSAKVLMLAIDGSNPLPILEHLAGDRHFSGRVICSLAPYWLAGRGSSSEDRTLEWLHKYSVQTLSSKIEAILSRLVQSHLVFRSSSLTPQNIWSKWHRDEAILPPYAPMRPDRFRPADYTLTDLASLRAAREQRTLEMHEQAEFLQPEAFRGRIARIRQAVDMIEARGGKVAFIRFPSCGRVGEIEETTIPRRKYWDVFANRISTYALHFEDYPQLSTFQCTDGSHLNYDDADRFTRELAVLLQSKGFFR
jgi:hypothetical protein